MAVTIPEVNNYDNKRELTESPATTIFKEIERIGGQQQQINQQQQFINKRAERSRSRIVELGTDIKRQRGRFGFLETTLIDLVSTLMKNCDQLSNLLPRPKESSKKSRAKTRS